MKKIMKLSSIALLILLGGLILFVGYIRFTTQNKTYGEIRLQGLSGAVTITRDQYGVPHIHAMKSDADAFFALGYTHAQDRLWQMEFQRRIAHGTLSEVLGPKTLDKDKFLRTMGFYRVAEKAWNSLDARTQNLISHYTQGINAFLSHGHLPLQFKILRFKPKRWTNADSIVWMKLMAWDLQSMWREKILNYSVAQQFGKEHITEFYPSYPVSSPTVLSHEDIVNANLDTKQQSERLVKKNNINDVSTRTVLQKTLTLIDSINQYIGVDDVLGKGSNNWVVSGHLTQSGKPILANDPHLRLQAPSIWYLAEIKGPHLHAIGGTVPGLPMVVLGRNDTIAWGVTNVDPDTQDLYIEPKDTHFKTHKEIIKVRGQEPATYIVRESTHGPIISDALAIKDIDKPIAMKWTALMPNDTTAQSMIEIEYAQSWQQFLAALKHYVTPSVNCVYADIYGNIGYYVPGKIPLREGWSGALPIAPNEHHEWTGFIPFEKLPHAYNPQEGFIVTANNKIAPNNYPYDITFRWVNPGYRSQRIHDLLKQNRKLSLDDMKAIQLDSVSYFWREMKTTLLSTQALDKKSKIALSILRQWDGNTNAKSVAASIFNRWFILLQERLQPNPSIDARRKNPLYVLGELKRNSENCQLIAKAKNCSVLLQTTLKQVVGNLSKQLGNNMNEWEWGRLHQARFEMLALGKVPALGWIWNQSIPSSGDDFSVNVGTYDVSDFHQTHGASYREIVDLSNMNNSQYIEAIGQSGNVFDTHYNDQLAKWSKGEYIKMSTRAKDWGKTQTLTLLPGG